MKEKLIQYVDLLFTGAADCEDIKQEILQNTLDRYDDLLSEGKTPEAAYRLAILGIGDISEILGSVRTAPAAAPAARAQQAPGKPVDTTVKKLLRTIAIGLYILSPIPMFVLSEIGMEVIGLCGVLAIVAVATVLIILGGKRSPELPSKQPPSTSGEELRKSIFGVVSAVALAAYFIISFMTMAWHITWVIFPLAGAVKGLIKAVIDLLEVNKYEN